MSREAEDLNRRLLRARDAMDRAHAEPLDVRSVAAVAHMSSAHFSRSFRAVFGESPHRYGPMDHFYGTDMGIRDPFGNGIRVLERKKAAHAANA